MRPRNRLPSESKIAAAVNRILAGSIGLPQTKRLKYFQDEIRKLPKEWQGPVENLVNFGKQLTSTHASTPSIFQLVSIGVCFLVIGGCGIVYFEQHEALTRSLFIFLFAIGMGFVGAAIPGVLKVKASKWLGMRVDATSGAGFFVVTLLVLLHYLR